jgi:hypothetical protein
VPVGLNAVAAILDSSSRSHNASSPLLPPDAGRRSNARKTLRCPVSIRTTAGVQRDGTTWDVGLDGLCVVLDKPLSTFRCEVSFELPNVNAPARLNLAARVVYSTFVGRGVFKIGMRFTSVDAASAALLAQFVAHV